LNPKKAKQLSNITAKELNQDQELVDDVLDFYWLKVRKMLGNIDYPYIRLPNLGTFSIRYNNLLRKIKFIEKSLEQPAPSSFVKYTIYNTLKEKIVRYREAQQVIEEYITKKNQHNNAKKNKKNLGE
jgi:hypothetical protein